jgi:hypothetical protein
MALDPITELKKAAHIAKYPAPPADSYEPVQTEKVALIPLQSTIQDYLDITFDTDVMAAMVSQSIETTLASKATTASLTSVSQSIETTLASKATTASLTSVSQSIETTLASTNAKLNGFFPFASVTGSCANDAAAQAAGVPVGGLYHTAGAVKVRLT